MRYFPKAILHIVFALVLLGAAGCTGAAKLSGSPGRVLAIEDVTVIDGVNGVRERQSVVARDGTIVKVGAAGDVRIPKGARVIDGRGRYLIPGLWDAHVHLTFISGLGIDTWYPLLIANGITSVRDMGGRLEKVLPLREAARAEGAVAPRVFLAGPLIDGHPPVYGGQPPGTPDVSVVVGTAEEARAEIDSLKAAGVDFIKLYEMLAPDVFTAAVHYAHEQGFRVAAHVPLSMDVVDAAKAGVDSMEHLRNFEMACAADAPALLAERRTLLAGAAEDSGNTLRRRIYARQRVPAARAQDPSRCDRMIAALVDNHVFQTPTLTNIASEATGLYATPEWLASLDTLPVAVRKDWLDRTAKLRASAASPDERVYTDWAMAMVAKLNRRGLKFLTGTDAPSHFLTPGVSLHQELTLLVAAGLTPMDALTAATLRPAEFMGMTEKLGSIDEGKWADMVLLSADPLDDIRNTNAILTVVKGGRVFDRAALDAMLAALKTRNAH